MKNNFVYIGLIKLFLLSVLSLNAQEPRVSPELVILTKDGSGDYTFEMTSTSSIVWEAKGPGDDSIYITIATKYVDPGDITIPGDGSVTNQGWNSDKHPNEGPLYQPLLGRAYYKLKVAYTNDSLTVNCYGVEFDQDIRVTYDCDDSLFLVEGKVVTSIDLYTNATKWLQPTKPRNFKCTNPNSSGQNPNFAWAPPIHPEISNSYFRYKIYRKEGNGSFICVASNLNTTSWTDQTVTIGSNGTLFTYKATAHTTNSPESAPSGLAIIRANPHKAKPGEFNNENADSGNHYTYKLNVFPNPFNPITAIYYSVSEPAHIRLSILNIAGQQIANLVDEYQHPGEYSVQFNGQSLAGGIYLVRLLTNDQHVT